MDNKNNPQAEVRNEGEGFSLKNFFKACVSKWRWFVISITFFTCIGVLYVLRQQPKYERTMSVLIKDQNDGGGVSSIANSFSSLGLVSTNTNVYNELISLMSPAVMADVVAQLHLDVNYLQKELPHGITLYGKNQPFVVEFLDLQGEQSGIMKIDVSPDGSMKLYKFVRIEGDKKEKINKEIKVPAGTSVVRTPLGRVKFSTNPRYAGLGFDEETTIVVSRSGFRRTVESYVKKLNGDLADRDAEIINLSIKDVSEERADDILNTILEVYGQKYINDKNRMSVATSKFIDDRLSYIKAELDVIDENIKNFKEKNSSPDLGESVKLNLMTSLELDKDIIAAESQLQLSRDIAAHVNNPAREGQVIPVISGGVSNQLEVQIATYNSMLSSRNSLAESTSDQNPLVKDYDKQLRGMRESIKNALNTQVEGYASQLRNLESSKSKLSGQLSAQPAQYKYIRSVDRELRVKEQLYLFLLQKREENELTQTFTADNTRVITPPNGSVRPVSPKKGLTVALAFMFGLVLPGVLVYMQESSNTKVRSRKDLERMSTPFIGEIPFVGKKVTKVSKLFKSKRKKKLESVEFMVKPGSRDMINESFRIVRGNLEFMTRMSRGQVIMVTSFNPGSGKSFVTYNLCASFAIKGKRVLLIDCDLRHGSSSQFVGMPSKGITSYLTGNTPDWNRLVVPVPEVEGFSVLPIGHRPPNPAELLDTDAMRRLIEEARREYDIVFLDCPPVDVVVDTQILSPLADRTIFVVRAGLLEKSSISDIDALYNDLRFKNMTILLNGTEQQFSRYGADGRGYYGSEYAVD